MSEYDLRDLKAPITQGAALRLLAGLAEGRVTGALLAAKFFGDIGIHALREVEVSEGLPASWAVPAPEAVGPGSALDGTPASTDALGALPGPPASAWRPETAADFVAAYRDGRLTPTAVAERVLAAARDLDARSPAMRLFIAQRHDDVLAQAEQATARYREGRARGPLDGVPVGVKDELDQAPYPTSVGTSFLGTRAAAQDASVVARLREAGAVLVGKLNMHEIGLGVTGLNPHHGACRNPYDPARATGGSSSGSAAAVAAGICPIAVGADGGGSVRIPASLCGVVGLKATLGRISEAGAAPLCWSVAHVGPLAASVADCALAYAHMAGPDARDEGTAHQPAPTLEDIARTDLSGVRLGVYRPWFEHAEADVVAACRRGLDALVAAGARVVEIEVPELALLRTAHLITIVSEMASAHLTLYARHRKDYGADTRLNLALGRRMRNTDYVTAQRLRARFRAHFDAVYGAADVVVTPATARTAPVLPEGALRSGQSDLGLTDAIMRFAPAANLVGLPALSVPVGYDGANLPVGLQLMGPAWSEHLLLRLGAVVEAATERRAPVVGTRLLGA
jgi:Asp-tRNA(Asn)/Glu-tRNA(Gln) amidotransferase A subunit family amidase